MGELDMVDLLDMVVLMEELDMVDLLDMVVLLEELDMPDLLEELDMPDLLEGLDVVDLLEESDMEVSLGEDLLELLLHLWPVLMDSLTVESSGAKAEDTTLVSYFTGHNNSQTWTHQTYKRQK